MKPAAKSQRILVMAFKTRWSPRRHWRPAARFFFPRISRTAKSFMANSPFAIHSNEREAGTGSALFVLFVTLAHPVQHLVPRARKGQEPWLAVIESQRRSGKWNPHKGILRLVSRHHFGNLLPLIRGHGDTVPGIADGVVHAVHLPGVRHDVKGEIERPSPNVFQTGLAQLRVHDDQ